MAVQHILFGVVLGVLAAMAILLMGHSAMVVLGVYVFGGLIGFVASVVVAAA
jgi:hypothetical protein